MDADLDEDEEAEAESYPTPGCQDCGEPWDITPVRIAYLEDVPGGPRGLVYEETCSGCGKHSDIVHWVNIEKQLKEFGS